MSDTTEEVDFINNDETEETTVEESQENLESDSNDSQDDGLTPKSREWKEKLREKNRIDRERSKKLDEVERDLAKQKLFRKLPIAENYEKEIDEFLAKNPTISLNDSVRYVLADVNPSALVALQDEPSLNKMTQSRNTMSGGDKSFSEQIEATPANTPDQLRKEAMKEMSKMLG